MLINSTAEHYVLKHYLFVLKFSFGYLQSGASSQNLNTSGKMNSISSQINGVSKVSADPKYGAISTENVVYVESGNQLWNGSEEELPLIKNNSKQNYDVSKLTPLPAPVANAPNGSIGNQFNLLFKTNSSIGSNLNLGLSTKPMPRGGVELTPNDVTVSNEVDQHGYYHSNLGSDFQGMDKLRVSVKPKGIFDCCSHITAEVYVILFIYVINKTGQEIAASSIPILTLSLFSWDSESAGYYMGVLGAVVLPSTIAVGLMVKNMQDRDIAIRLSFVALIASIIAINNFLVPYSLVQFILGSAALFSSLNALEGIIMSLLSKLVSPELAKGTFNSGLLATEAGTFGRVVGDMTITLLGVSSEPTALLNSLYLPVTAGLLISIALLHYFYDDLTV